MTFRTVEALGPNSSLDQVRLVERGPRLGPQTINAVKTTLEAVVARSTVSMTIILESNAQIANLGHKRRRATFREQGGSVALPPEAIMTLGGPDVALFEVNRQAQALQQVQRPGDHSSKSSAVGTGPGPVVNITLIIHKGMVAHCICQPANSDHSNDTHGVTLGRTIVARYASRDVIMKNRTACVAAKARRPEKHLGFRHPQPQQERTNRSPAQLVETFHNVHGQAHTRG